MEAEETILDQIRNLISSGHILEASNLAKVILNRNPNNSTAVLLMARIARLASQPSLALELIEPILSTGLKDTEVLTEHAEILLCLNQTEAAAAVYREITRFDSDHFQSNAFLGRYCASNLRIEEACRYLQRAVSVKSDPDLYNLLGHLFSELKQENEAEAALRMCLESAPQHLRALQCLGNLFKQRGQLEEAIDCFRLALAAEPNHPDVLQNLANTCLAACVPLAHCAKFLRLDAETLSHMVFALNYQSEFSRDEIASAHRIWGARQIKPSSPLRVRSTPGQPIRVGLVSSDFYQHPVGRFAVLLCSYLNRKDFSLVAYHNSQRQDTLTEHLKSLNTVWRNIANQSDDEALQQMRSDRIDILVDLSGHTANNRLTLFAQRAAPIQITVFAYPNTSGLETMDYRVTDPFADPPGKTEHLGTETLLRLNKTPWVYLPLATAPDVRPLPCTTGKPFTFGCLNNPLKFSSACFRLWSEILKGSPDSRLMLLSNHPAHDARLTTVFSEHGVSASQLWLVRAGFLTDYFEYYHSVDLILDSVPYNGAVTSCDALWMGVPVLTLEGDSYVSRQGVSILSNLGLEEFIAPTPREYTGRAIRLAQAPDSLLGHRMTLRNRLQSSALTDYHGYADELGAALKNVWMDRRRMGR
ncbi:MAG: tetratricopeptide repeat protein [Verrucomicrobia bacterium]|nr:tetratricopeptide repeat protein [Verrucomicrobiota bacterium]